MKEILAFMKIVKWQWSDPNDLTAFYRNYTFRIERMNKGIWWFAIYQDQPNPKNRAKTIHVEFTRGQSRSKKEAKFTLVKNFLTLTK